VEKKFPYLFYLFKSLSFAIYIIYSADWSEIPSYLVVQGAKPLPEREDTSPPERMPCLGAGNPRPFLSLEAGLRPARKNMSGCQFGYLDIRSNYQL
jgi:hypothetical protein